MNHPQILIKILSYNLLKSHVVTIYSHQKHSKLKLTNIDPLIESITTRGWKIDPLIVITTHARAATHTPSMKIFKDKFKLPMPAIRNTFKNINTIAIQYAMSILLHKRRLENNQPLPQIQDPPSRK
jgi:hypothetical protein